MQKILLYYKFTPIKEPELLKLWQKALCESLELKGRILVSPLKAYVKAMKQFPGFKDTVWKWSDGSQDNFPRLSVKVKKELVAFDTWNEIEIDEGGLSVVEPI